MPSGIPGSSTSDGHTPSYYTVHRRARKQMADTCARCGDRERLEAALKPSTPAERLLTCKYKGLRYSANLNDYEALCVPCHRHQDIGKGRPNPTCRKGHPLTPDNIRFHTNGRRQCLTCYRTSHNAWYDKVRSDPAKWAEQLEYQRSYSKLPEQRTRRTERGRIWNATRNARNGSAL